MTVVEGRLLEQMGQDPAEAPLLSLPTVPTDRSVRSVSATACPLRSRAAQTTLAMTSSSDRSARRGVVTGAPYPLGDLVEVRAGGPSLTRVQPEAVTGVARDHVQVHMEDLLTGGLAVREE